MKRDGESGFRAALRTARGDLTQGQLGELMSTELGEAVAQSTVSEWENGDRIPDPQRVFALERVLNCEPGELSAHLGYFPVGEIPGVLQAIDVDAEVSDDMKQVLRTIYTDHVGRSRKRRNRR